MPTASQRGTSDDKKGASTSSNETPVSTAEQPNPPADATARPSPKPATSASPIDLSSTRPRGVEKAHGLDHPAESEHDHKHQKLKGVSAKRVSESHSTDLPSPNSDKQ